MYQGKVFRLLPIPDLSLTFSQSGSQNSFSLGTFFQGHTIQGARPPKARATRSHTNTRREGTRSVQGTQVLKGRSPLAERLPQDSKGHVSLRHVPQGHTPDVSRARVSPGHARPLRQVSAGHTSPPRLLDVPPWFCLYIDELL